MYLAGLLGWERGNISEITEAVFGCVLAGLLGWEWGNISEITEAVFGCVLSRTAGVGVG